MMPAAMAVLTLAVLTMAILTMAQALLRHIPRMLLPSYHLHP